MFVDSYCILLDQRPLGLRKFPPNGNSIQRGIQTLYVLYCVRREDQQRSSFGMFLFDGQIDGDVAIEVL